MSVKRALLLACAVLLLGVPVLALTGALRSWPDSPVTADGAGGGGVIEAVGRALVAPSPSVDLGSDTVVQSSELGLTARGFAPDEPIFVEAVLAPGTDTVEVYRATAGADGNLSEITITLPEAVTSGQRTIRLVGQRSGRTAEADFFVVSERPWLQLRAETLQPTDMLGFVAGGFQPRETVRIAFGLAEAPSTSEIAADRAGNTAWTELPLPSFQPGEYELLIVGAESGTRLNRTVRVAPLSPVLELSPWYGPPGGKLELNGRGFLPHERVSLSYNRSGVSELEADEYGNLWGVRAPDVPYEAMQSLVVTLTGADSGATTSVEFKVADPHPWVELSTYAGAPGTGVYLSGGGWAARERVSLHVGQSSSPAVGIATSDEYGFLRFAGPVPIPASADDEVEIVALGERSGAEASARFTVVRPIIPVLPPLPPPPAVQLPTPAPRPTPAPAPAPTPKPTISPL